jgi:hypothetical protein
LKNFLLRHGLLFRTAIAARRPQINDEKCSAFLCPLNKAQEEFPPDHVISFDESSWHLIMSEDEVMKEVGSKVVHNFVDGGAKANFVFCFDSGRRISFPLILIARGTTERYHKQFGGHPNYQHELWHSSRW